MKGPSYLSPHLRFGTLSIRRVAALALTRSQQHPDSEGAATWLSELIWREFYQAILVHFPGVLEESFRANLRAIRKQADEAGIGLYGGSWSICPTSKTFKKNWGTAEEHLRLGLRVSKALGSPVFRVVLGSMEDRKTEGGIRARIADLTPREKEVMDLVTAGKANKIIAGDLDVSQRTVEIHRARVMEKMGASSLAHLVRMIIAAGEVTPN